MRLNVFILPVLKNGDFLDVQSLKSANSESSITSLIYNAVAASKCALLQIAIIVVLAFVIVYMLK